MLLTFLTIARKPARLTASRLRRSERTNRSEATRKVHSTFRLKHPERSELNVFSNSGLRFLFHFYTQ
jgi:hypothetical protein